MIDRDRDGLLAERVEERLGNGTSRVGLVDPADVRERSRRRLGSAA